MTGVCYTHFFRDDENLWDGRNFIAGNLDFPLPENTVLTDTLTIYFLFFYCYETK